jgi:hypothetical protein
MLRYMCIKSAWGIALQIIMQERRAEFDRFATMSCLIVSSLLSSLPATYRANSQLS